MKSRVIKVSHYQRRKSSDPFRKITNHISQKTFEILQDLSKDKCLPIDRLISIAIDKELRRSLPFEYPCDLPTEYTEYMFAGEAKRLLDFFIKLPKGVDIQSLMLCRRDIGIPVPMALLGAVKELLEKKMIEAYRPGRSDYSYYHRDYTKLRLVRMSIKEHFKKRFKRFEGVDTKYQRVKK